MIEAEGYDKRLNNPARSKFFIDQADGNVVYLRGWIIDYVKAGG